MLHKCSDAGMKLQFKLNVRMRMSIRMGSRPESMLCFLWKLFSLSSNVEDALVLLLR